MTYKLIDYERLKAFSEGLKSKYATKNDIPKKLSDLKEDTTHRLVTDTEKKKWNDKVSQSQITSDANATGDNKVWSVDFVKKQFQDFDGAKIDKSQITDEYIGESQEKVASQKAVRNLADTFDSVISSIRMDVNEKANKSEIPKKLSQLENDKTFKTESEIQSMIEKASSLKKEVVTSLPTTGKDDVIYLVQDPKGKDNNNYLEYLWLNGKYELIGSTQVDLTGYAKLSDIDTNTNILNKERDKANMADVFNQTGAGKYVDANLLFETKKEINADLIMWISEHMKLPDIQEFTQQELEEAFK